MKSLALMGAFATALCAAARAESLEDKLAEKLNKPFVKHIEWITDYDQALDAAKSSGKLIFAYFSRSYSP